MAFLAQDADTGDIGRSTDGGAVTTQGCTGQQAEVQSGGVDAHLGGDAGNNGDHGRNIGDVVDKRGDQHGSPDNDGVHQEGIACAQLSQQLRQSIDDTHIGDAADHQKQANQQSQSLKVDGLQGSHNGIQIFLLCVVVDQTDNQQSKADQAVGLSGHLEGQEGSHDQQHDSTDQQHSGNHIGDFGHLARLGDSTLILAEGEVNDTGRENRAQLHHEEHTRLTLIPDEVQEAHV